MIVEFKEKYIDLIEYIKKSKKTLLLILIVLIITYWGRLISNSFSIDTELYIQDYKSSFEWWFNLQRWGLVLLNKLFKVGPLVISFNTIITVIFIYIYSILFNYLFYINIDKKYQKNYFKYQSIFSLLFITNPIFAEQYNFLNQSLSVSLAICLIPISLILINRNKCKVNYFISILLNAIAFGTYQAIIPLYISTVVACYFFRCVTLYKNEWKYLFKQIIVFLISSIIYILISKILSEGNSYLQSGWAANGLMCLKYIYYVFIDMLRCNTIYYNIGYVIALLLLLLSNIYLIVKKRNNTGTIISSIGLALSPLYIMIITGVDQLKRTQFNYSFTIGFIFLSIFVLFYKENKIYKYIKVIVIVIAIGIIFSQSFITAELFYSDHVRFENDVTYANKIQSMIEEKKWYNENQEYTLIFLGQKKNKGVNTYIEGEILGKSFFSFDYQYHYGVSQRANALFASQGYNYKKPTAEEFENAKKYALEKELKYMPSKDCIYNDNNLIIIRLSEEI